MLVKLSKKDEKWRRLAFVITKDKQLADDIVQDMYLKAIRYNKELNDGYVYLILKSIYFDYLRKQNKTISIEKLFYLKDNVSTFEPNDKEQTYLDRFDNIDWKEQQLILEHYDKSLREIEEEFPLINYQYAYRTIQKGIKKVLKEDYPKYNNTRLKFKKNG